MEGLGGGEASDLSTWGDGDGETVIDLSPARSLSMKENLEEEDAESVTFANGVVLEEDSERPADASVEDVSGRGGSGWI